MTTKQEIIHNAIMTEEGMSIRSRDSLNDMPNDFEDFQQEKALQQLLATLQAAA